MKLFYDSEQSEVRADQQVSVVEDPSSGSIPSNISSLDVLQTAAVVFATNLYSRAFAAAEITPRYMEPWELAGVARDMMLRGEWVAQLLLDRDSFFFARASDHDIMGGVRPSSWRYRLTLPAPSESRNSVALTYDSVAHVRINTNRTSPWRGISPFTEMGVTSRLLSLIENGLCDEEDIIRLQVLSFGPGVSNQTELAEDLSEGGMQLLNQSVQSFGQARSGIGNSVRNTRIGPTPEPAEVQLRAQVSQDILSAAGVPAGLYSPREGSVNREAYRQWHASGLEPMGEAFRAEIEKKTERPFEITFHRLAAADIAARARGLNSLIQSNVIPEDAARVVGMSGLRIVEPEPEPVIEVPSVAPSG